MKQDVEEFESKLRALWEEYKAKLTHGEMVGTWEIVRLDYMVGTLLDNTIPVESPALQPAGALKLPGVPGSPIPKE